MKNTLLPSGSGAFQPYAMLSIIHFFAKWQKKSKNHTLLLMIRWWTYPFEKLANIGYHDSWHAIPFFSQRLPKILKQHVKRLPKLSWRISFKNSNALLMNMEFNWSIFTI